MSNLYTPAQRANPLHVDAPIPTTRQDRLNLRKNSGLPQRTWDQIDDVIQQVFRWPNSMLDDLQTRGLTDDISFGTMLSQWENMSDMETAERSMDGISNSMEADVEFDLNAIPVPITFKQYSHSTRRSEAAGERGIDLDMTKMDTAARRVRDSLEDLITNGDPTISMNNAKAVYGYSNHPDRETFTINNDWDGSTPGAAYAVDDTASMLQLAYNNNIEGPFILYINKSWYASLQRDYNAESSQTWIDRLEAFPDIDAVHVGRKLANTEAVLVDMNRRTVDLQVAVSPDTLTWTSGNGLTRYFYTYAVMVPRIKSDYGNRCGVVMGT